MFIAFAVAGYFCYAVVAIVDKKILTRATPPIVYAFYSTIISLLGAAALPWAEPLRGRDWLFSAVAAVSFSLGLIILFAAVEKSEVSHVGPFNGALISVFLYLLSFFLLGERLTLFQTAGVGMLVAASLLLSFQVTKEGGGIPRRMGFAVGSAFCLAVSQIATKYLYLGYPFLTVLVWNSIFIGAMGVLFLLHPAVRASFGKKSPRARMPLVLVAADKVIAFIAVLLVQYAIAQGSVTIIGALSGLQFVFLFLLVLALSRFAPRLFEEFVTRREVFLQGAALLLAVLGLAFLAL